MEYVEGETLAQIIPSLEAADPDTETPFGRKDEVSLDAPNKPSLRLDCLLPSLVGKEASISETQEGRSEAGD